MSFLSNRRSELLRSNGAPVCVLPMVWTHVSSMFTVICVPAAPIFAHAWPLRTPGAVRAQRPAPPALAPWVQTALCLPPAVTPAAPVQLIFMVHWTLLHREPLRKAHAPPATPPRWPRIRAVPPVQQTCVRLHQPALGLLGLQVAGGGAQCCFCAVCRATCHCCTAHLGCLGHLYHTPQVVLGSPLHLFTYHFCMLQAQPP